MLRNGASGAHQVLNLDAPRKQSEADNALPPWNIHTLFLVFYNNEVEVQKMPATNEKA